jgi:cation diffusion facilitator family transporter
MEDREHTHAFGQDQIRPGERRTILVIILTGVMMLIEITAGLVYGSMALLADGLHMASHASALAITAFAYIYARQHAFNPEYSFGTGKVNSLGAFTGAVLLAVFALVMAAESLKRLFYPVDIAFNQAIFVSVVGLIVNGVSVFILGGGHQHDQEEEHAHDHNLRSAYLHVMADALTSLLAIFALLAAKYAGMVWMDPVMGIVGAILVARWSVGLMKMSGAVLLDRQAPESLQQAIISALQDEETRVRDLHVWAIGPGIYAVIVSLTSNTPLPAADYKARLPDSLGLEHVSVEVNECAD